MGAPPGAGTGRRPTMENRVYTIPEASREKVQKVLARYAKKATKYGAALNAEFGATYVKEFSVYALDPVEHVKYDTHEKALYEVFDLTIESEQIKKDGYSVIARIEHLDNGNVVTPFHGETEARWTALKPHCDHCNGNHGQLVTFIVRDDAGNEKQVGRTCLKDYCGIDPQAVGLWNELVEVIEGEDSARYDWEGCGVRSAIDIRDALAAAVMLQRTKGYLSSGNPGCNKEMLSHMMSKGEHAGENDYKAADMLIAEIRKMSREEAVGALLDNVKTLIDCGYCKYSHCGYVAYAPLAYERHKEKKAQEAARAAEKDAARESSEYVGEIGKRMVVDVKDFKLVMSWETEWGCTYLYKFSDASGNVMVWYASRELGEWVRVKGGEEWRVPEVKKLKVTVKDHNEHDGVKQTVVTRCTLVA